MSYKVGESLDHIQITTFLIKILSLSTVCKQLRKGVILFQIHCFKNAVLQANREKYDLEYSGQLVMLWFHIL